MKGPVKGAEQSAGEMAVSLRQAATPVIARVERGALLLDPRTVLDGQEEELLKSVASAATLG